MRGGVGALTTTRRKAGCPPEKKGGRYRGNGGGDGNSESNDKNNGKRQGNSNSNSNSKMPRFPVKGTVTQKAWTRSLCSGQEAPALRLNRGRDVNLRWGE
jgi:hypothetical protein